MSNGFFAKIKDNYGSKFSSLSISSGSAQERDGNTEDDTLIHNAFIKYFDSINEEYPDWLGANAKQVQNAKASGPRSKYDYYKNAEFKPVQQENRYNRRQPQGYSPQYSPQNQSPQSQSGQFQPQSNETSERPVYQSRSSSRLQDMHNKSKQQGSYGQLPYQPARTNSTSLAGSRLRERMMNPGTRNT